MKQELKALGIVDTYYYVDIDNTRLISVENRDNVLRIQEMTENENGYEFNYDVKGKFIANELIGSRNTIREIVKVQIPFLKTIDPEAMASKYGIHVSMLPSRDSELKCRLQMLEERVVGKLPVLKIHDHDFFVDLRLGLLRPKDDFRTIGIVLDELAMDSSCTVFQCLYHTKKHEIYHWREDIKSIPPHVVPIEIPCQAVLDPFGYAMKYSDLNGLTSRYPIGKMEEIKAIDWQATGMKDFFDQYPLRDNLRAQVIDWDQTSLPEIISRNQAKKKQAETPKVKNKRRGL